jgi:hypothetical protein
MKKYLVLVLTAFMVIALSGTVWAATQDVVVTVGDINEVSVVTESIDITIVSSDATAGTATVSQSSDVLTDELKWTTNGTGKKITVAVTAAPAKYTLKVTGSNITEGAGTLATMPVSLNATAADFITSIATSAGDCDIQYTVEYDVSKGTVTAETNTVTYTITDAVQ